MCHLTNTVKDSSTLVRWPYADHYHVGVNDTQSGECCGFRACDRNGEISGVHTVGQHVGVDASRLNEQNADAAGGRHRRCGTTQSEV